jgi:hypothetical protein
MIDNVQKPSNLEDSFVFVCHTYSVSVENTLIVILKSSMLYKKEGLRLAILRVFVGELR